MATPAAPISSAVWRATWSPITITGDAWCRATDKTYRVDTPAARDFLDDFVTLLNQAEYYFGRGLNSGAGCVVGPLCSGDAREQPRSKRPPKRQ